MMIKRILALLVLVLGGILGWLVVATEQTQGLNNDGKFQLGLDLSGGSYLVYRADLSGVEDLDTADAMDSVRDVIERRVNAFGIAEPSVTTETVRLGNGREERLVIELPGITDVAEAVEMIGQTPLLEFKVERPEDERQEIIDAIQEFINTYAEDPTVEPEGLAAEDPFYIDTPLTGRYLSRATLQFSQGAQHGGTGLAGTPMVALRFDREGSQLFEDITRENLGKTIAIYLDGSAVSAPVVNQVITGGEAVISGNFTPDEAKTLEGRLNSGALPVPIELISTQTIGASLGADAAAAGVKATLLGLLLVAIVLMIWYRLPGFLATFALMIYGVVMLGLFKVLPVTLTAAGIAGFIISLGIAVDANILIFERLKEELRRGAKLPDAIREGFSRAWPSIRDANISSLISALVLFFASGSLIKGFALTFGLGILISMLTAIGVTRVLLVAVAGNKNSKIMRALYSAGFARNYSSKDTTAQ